MQYIKTQGLLIDTENKEASILGNTFLVSSNSLSMMGENSNVDHSVAIKPINSNIGSGSVSFNSESVTLSSNSIDFNSKFIIADKNSVSFANSYNSNLSSSIGMLGINEILDSSISLIGKNNTITLSGVSLLSQGLSSNNRSFTVLSNNVSADNNVSVFNTQNSKIENDSFSVLSDEITALNNSISINSKNSYIDNSSLDIHGIENIVDSGSSSLKNTNSVILNNSFGILGVDNDVDNNSISINGTINNVNLQSVDILSTNTDLSNKSFSVNSSNSTLDDNSLAFNAFNSDVSNNSIELNGDSNINTDSSINILSDNSIVSNKSFAVNSSNNTVSVNSTDFNSSNSTLVDNAIAFNTNSSGVSSSSIDFNGVNNTTSSYGVNILSDNSIVSDKSFAINSSNNTVSSNSEAFNTKNSTLVDNAISFNTINSNVNSSSIDFNGVNNTTSVSGVNILSDKNKVYDKSFAINSSNNTVSSNSEAFNTKNSTLTNNSLGINTNSSGISNNSIDFNGINNTTSSYGVNILSDNSIVSDKSFAINSSNNTVSSNSEAFNTKNSTLLNNSTDFNSSNSTLVNNALAFNTNSSNVNSSSIDFNGVGNTTSVSGVNILSENNTVSNKSFAINSSNNTVSVNSEAFNTKNSTLTNNSLGINTNTSNLNSSSIDFNGINNTTFDSSVTVLSDNSIVSDKSFAINSSNNTVSSNSEAFNTKNSTLLNNSTDFNSSNSTLVNNALAFNTNNSGISSSSIDFNGVGNTTSVSGVNILSERNRVFDKSFAINSSNNTISSNSEAFNTKNSTLINNSTDFNSSNSTLVNNALAFNTNNSGISSSSIDFNGNNNTTFDSSINILSDSNKVSDNSFAINSSNNTVSVNSEVFNTKNSTLTNNSLGINTNNSNILNDSVSIGSTSINSNNKTLDIFGNSNSITNNSVSINSNNTDLTNKSLAINTTNSYVSDGSFSIGSKNSNVELSSIDLFGSDNFLQNKSTGIAGSNVESTKGNTSFFATKDSQLNSTNSLAIGGVSITQSLCANNPSTGTNILTIGGFNNKAGSGSIVIGGTNNSISNNSVSIGGDNNSTGQYSNVVMLNVKNTTATKSNLVYLPATYVVGDIIVNGKLSASGGVFEIDKSILASDSAIRITNTISPSAAMIIEQSNASYNLAEFNFGALKKPVFYIGSDGVSVNTSLLNPANALTVNGDISANKNINLINSSVLNIGDTNLYRSATNTLKTNDNFVVGTLATSTSDNSVIVENSGTLRKRTINSRVWDTNATFLSGVGLNTNIIPKAEGPNKLVPSNISDDNSTVTINKPTLIGQAANGLTLVGTTHTYMQFYPNLIGGGRKAWLGFGSTNDKKFYITSEQSGGVGHIFLKPSRYCNVGIGDASFTPSKRLTISGLASASNSTFAGGSSLIRLQGSTAQYSEPAIEFAELALNPTAKISSKNRANGGGDLIFQTRSTSSKTSPITEKVRITDAGKVGIGTSSPDTKLHLYIPDVGGGVTDILKIEVNRVDHGLSPSGPAILFKDQDTNNATNEARIKMMTVNDTDYGDNDEAASNFVFETTNNGIASDKMIITGRGNVGLNVMNPQTKLHVAGDVIYEDGRYLDSSKNVKISTLYIRGTGLMRSGTAVIRLDNTTLVSTASRGLTLVGLDRNFNVVYSKTHDVYSSNSNYLTEQRSLASALTGIGPLSGAEIGMLVSYDAWQVNVQELKDAATLVGLSKLANWRGGYATNDRIPYAAVFAARADSTKASYSTEVIEKLETGTNTSKRATIISDIATNGDDVIIGGSSSVNAIYSANPNNPDPVISVDGYNVTTIDGTIKTPNIGTGTDNSVVVLDTNGYLKTDEIDSRVWGSSLVDGSGSTNYLTKWSDGNTVTNTRLFDNGTNFGLNTNNPKALLDISVGPNRLSAIAFSENNWSMMGIGADFVPAHGDNNLFIWTNGYNGQLASKDSIAVFKADGKVGIGTSNPLEKLHVDGSIYLNTTSSIKFGETTTAGAPSTDGVVIRYDNNFFGSAYDALVFEKTDFNSVDPDGGIAFTNRGSDGIVKLSMAIKGNGNVGIGTSNPTNKLTVAGNINATGTINTSSQFSAQQVVITPSSASDTTPDLAIRTPTSENNALRLFNNLTSSGYNPLTQSGDKGLIFSEDSPSEGNMIIGPWSSQSRGIVIDGKNGRVGINKRPSSYTFDVNGSIGCSSNLTVNGGVVSIGRGNTTSEGGELRLHRSSDNASFWGIDSYGSTSTPNLRFYTTTNSSVKMFINGSTGNVGIGNFSSASFPLSFGTSLGNKIGLYDAGSGNGYGFGVQTGLLQIFAQTSTNRVGIGYGNSSGFTETLTVKGSNVGVGNTAPAAKLAVGNTLTGSAASRVFTTNAGALGTSINSTLRMASFGFTSSNQTSLGIEAKRISAGGDWNSTAVGLQMNVDNTAPVSSASLWFRNNGNVGIGTSSPSYKLHVTGEIAATAANGKTLYIGGDSANNDLEIGTINSDVTTVSFWNRASVSAMTVSMGNAVVSRLASSTTDNSVIVENSGTLRKRTINSRVWDTNATFLSGSGTTTYLAMYDGSNKLKNSSITDGGINTRFSRQAIFDISGASLSSPQIAFNSTNVGLYYKNTDGLMTSIGGLEKFRVNSNYVYVPTKLGVGTTAVGTEKLNVNGAALIDGLKITKGTLTECTIIGEYAYNASSVTASAKSNTAFGYYALNKNYSGYHNVAIGNSTLRNNYSGYHNTAIGSAALYTNNSGYWNTAVGGDALKYNTNGKHNTAIGVNCLENNTTGSYNTGVGVDALYKNTTGEGNVGVGKGSLYSNTTGLRNTAIGNSALLNSNASDNTAIGYQCMYGNKTGRQNIAVGTEVLRYNTSGSFSVGIGYYCLAANTTGSYNTAIGYESLYKNTSGYYNTAIGFRSLYSSTTSGRNTAIGYESLYNNTTGYQNTAIGDGASKQNTTGNYNTAIGSSALVNNKGTGCVAVGERSLWDKTLGDYNTGIGKDSGNASIVGVVLGGAGAKFRSGSHNVFIGAGCGGSASTVSNEVNIYNGSVIARFKGAATGWSFVSDQRDKKNVEDLKIGLDFLTELKPRKFEWDIRNSDVDKGKTSSGFIAQEVLETIKNHDAEHVGLVNTNDPNRYMLTQTDLIPILVNAIKELKNEIELLKNR